MSSNSADARHASGICATSRASRLERSGTSATIILNSIDAWPIYNVAWPLLLTNENLNPSFYRHLTPPVFGVERRLSLRVQLEEMAGLKERATKMVHSKVMPTLSSYQRTRLRILCHVI